MSPKKWFSPARSSLAAVGRFCVAWWNRLSPEDLLPYSLAVVAAALTVWIAFELALPAQAQRAKPASETTGPQTQQTWAEGKAQVRPYLSAITRRGLFQASRERPTTRRQTSPAKPAPVPATQAQDIELMGVIGGESPEALIRDRRTGKTYTVTVGQVIGDMTVKNIAPRSIILQIGKSEVRIGL